MPTNDKTCAGLVATYLVVPLDAYQHQNVQVRCNAEKEDGKNKLTDFMYQRRFMRENENTNRQAEQAEEIRHCQVEEETPRDGRAAQMPAEFYYYSDVSRDPQQASDCDTHTSDNVPGDQIC